MASGIVAQDGLPACLRSTAQAPSALRGIVAARATRRTFPPCRRRPAVSQASPGASLYIYLCNCLILICSIQHQMKVKLWTTNNCRLW
ncbi:hypothetical protein EKN45_21425, partial [Enterobacter hormaechei]